MNKHADTTIAYKKQNQTLFYVFAPIVNSGHKTDFVISYPGV